MPAYTDPRTGRPYFKKQVRLADGTSIRIRGVPRDYDQPDTLTGAKKAEAIAVARLLAASTSGSSQADRQPATAAPVVPPVPIVPTVAEYLPVWLAKADVDNRKSTRKQKRGAIKNHLLPIFGHLRLNEITYSQVDQWRQELLRRPSEPETVARLLNTFHAFLNFAVDNDVLVKLPKWPKQPIPEKEQAFLSFAEADQLLAAPPPVTGKPWSAWKVRVMHAMLVVAARTGLRHGELTALRWQDVDLDAGKLWVHKNRVEGEIGPPKSGKGREVPLSNDAMRALRSVRQDRWPLVFTLDGRYLEYWTTDEALKFMCRSAKMMPIGWHTLRHTFASHLVMRGVALVTVQKLLGHANFKMTLRYSHLSPHVSRDAVLLLDQPAPPRSRGPASHRRKSPKSDAAEGAAHDTVPS